MPASPTLRSALLLAGAFLVALIALPLALLHEEQAAPTPTTGTQAAKTDARSAAVPSQASVDASRPHGAPGIPSPQDEDPAPQPARPAPTAPPSISDLSSAPDGAPLHASQPPATQSLASRASSRPTSDTSDGGSRLTVVVAPQDLPLLPEPTPPAHELDRSAETRRRRVQQFGGTAQTENAVEIGLKWLAAHQEPDGRWDRFAFNRRCPAQDRCAGGAIWRENLEMDAGITGLALLAFLGAGYTDREGAHQQTVSRGLRWLLRAQQPDGGFSVTEPLACYNDSVATLALAEFYELTQDASVRPALEAADMRLVRAQQPLGGWDYAPRPDTGRNDTSITGWVVQALQSARAGGVRVPPGTLCRAALHFVRAAEPDGRVRYSDTGLGTVLDDDVRMTYRYGGAMTAVGNVCGGLLGLRPDCDLIRRQRALLMAELPSTSLARGGDKLDLHSEYYWYYGTLAMFQAGSDSWDRWNGALRDALLPLQERKSAAQHEHGSWPPFAQGWGRWGRMGGRVYTTAINVLTLEIYYRHMPAYLERGNPPSAREWREFLGSADLRERRLSVAFLRGARLEIGEPVLAALLNDADPAVALGSAIALAEVGSPLGTSLLRSRYAGLSPSERPGAAAAIESCDALLKRPSGRGRVRFVDAERRHVTLDLEPAWVGMPLSVSADGAASVSATRPARRACRLVVLSRFSDAPQVVALITEAGAELPRPGDVVQEQR